MHILAMLIIGLIVGALAKLIMPGRHSHSLLLTMLLGMFGSVVAGVVGHATGWYYSATEGPGIIASTLGAMLVLAVYHLVMRDRTTRRLV